MKKIIFALNLLLSSVAFADPDPTEETVKWRPVVDNAKCVGALVWTLPTLAGLGFSQLGAGVSDLVALFVDGKICFTGSTAVLRAYYPVLKTLIEMGCVAPIDDLENLEYYTFVNLPIDMGSSSIRMFRCE